jgi:iron complex outermembrane receptor protein
LKIQTTRGRLLASTMICGVLSLGVGGHAFAADEAANKDSGSEVTEVVVTGSRLQRKDFTAISPVTTVGSEQLEMTGTVAVEQLVNELPQIVPGNTVTSNNSGGEDFATVDLRGLGAQRTLVVVNGERVPGSSTTGVVDLNTIPAGLIDRIEVLTGGASAVYGSDAMAGVVNFILKQNYEGAEVSALVGGNFHGQGKEFNLEGILGGNFANGRGNMTMYASYFQRNPVLQSEFDWSRTSAGVFYDNSSNGYVVDSAAKYNALNSAIPGGLHTFLSGGSGTPPWGWITNNPGNPFSGLAANPATAGRFASADTDCNPATPGVAVNGGNLSFNDAGQLTPRFTSKACAVPDRSAGSSRYNYAPTNDIIIPAKRYAISTFAHYDITDNITLKTQLSFIDSQSGVQLAATPATGLTVVLTPAMNAYINANHPDLAAALASRPNPTANFTEDWRSLQLGPRIGEFDNQSLSMLATLDGKINDNWNWSATASYGQTRFAETLRNNLNRTAIEQGLTGCQVPIATGNPGAGTDLGVAKLPGCTIADIFGQNKLSANAVKFLRTDTHQLNIYTEQRVAGFIRGDLIQLPAGGLSSVFGFEYREDHASLDVDDAQRTGNIYGFNAIQNQKGSVTVKEAYVELGVPLVKDQPFIQYLGLEGGYRWSDYDTIGSTETYKIGGEWSPFTWLKFRAVYNKAVRAPSVFELFQNGDQGFPSFVDPCNDKPTRTAQQLAVCQAMAPGVNFTGYNQNNSQVQAFAFGNPNLQPETGKTKTIGFVFQPDFLPVGRLKASVDYYDIQILNAVASVGAQTISNRCVAGGVPLNANCALIQRDPVTGQVVGINTSIANLSELRTKGWDVQIDFKVDLGDLFSGAPGRISINELYSYLSSFKQDGFEGRGTTNAAIGTAFPEYKSVLTVNYGVGDWLFQTRWSYTPEMIQGTATGYGLFVDKTPAASYVDISTRWNVTDNFQLTGTIGNLFDKEPPQFIDGVFNGQANTDPQVYRVLGRTFTLAAKVRF